MKSVIVLLALIVAALAAQRCTVGIPDASGGKAVTLQELVQNPNDYDNTLVQFTAKVRCLVDKMAVNKIEVGLDGVPATITVSAETGMFTYPLDAVGAEARVIGVFYNLDESLRDYLVEAVRVDFAASGTDDVCTVWPRDVTVQNLTAEPELETDYMGMGYVTLKPNEQMHRHSTNMSSEVVTVVQGSVMFIVFRNSQEAEKYELHAPAAIFVPHSTMHMVVNPFKVPAVYIYTHAMVPVTPAGLGRKHFFHHMGHKRHFRRLGHKHHLHH